MFKGLSTRRALAGSYTDLTEINPPDPTASILHQQSVSLNNAQIAGLPVAQIVVVPSPGVGRVLIPVALAGVADFTGGVYANVGSGARLYVATPDGYTLSGRYISRGVLLDDSEPQIVVPVDSPWSTSTTGPALYAGPQYLSGALNQPLLVFADNYDNAIPVGAFTGGGAGNTFTVSVSYLILNTSTGLFE